MPNNLVVVVMDSCRFDSFARAQAPTMARLGAAEQRYSYASWTSPSHQALLMGQLPHNNPRGVFASEVYKAEYSKWVDRLEVPNLSFKSFVPQLSLAKVLKGLGYRTVARVSMPVLNAFAGFNRNFDDYRLMANHNDFAGMVAEISFSAAQPSFYFLNLGETHYPYMLTDQELPKISGVHGVLAGMDDAIAHSGDIPSVEPEFFSADTMQALHRQQTKCVEYVDGVLDALVSKAPANTFFIVTADHGELFGEDGFFGHGPIMHTKCFEVPYLEAKKP